MNDSSEQFSALRFLLKSPVWPVLVILGAGLVAAWVCFGLLESQAEVEAPYALGGAFAGAFITWTVLGFLYREIRTSTLGLEALQEENRVLRDKLLRGAPRPSGFSVEVDEKVRLVLARPGTWEPRGGVVFDFQSPRQAPAEDIFPARFVVHAEPIRIDREQRRLSPEERRRRYYDELRENLGKRYTTPYSTELMYLDGVTSLRYTEHAYVRIHKRLHPTTGAESFDEQFVTPADFLAYVRSVLDTALRNLQVDVDDLLDESERQADGLLKMELRARRKEEIAHQFDVALEHGHTNPQRLLAEIETDLRGKLGKTETAGNTPGSTAAPAVEAVRGASQPTLSGPKGTPQDGGPAFEGARGVGSDGPRASQESVDIVPVGRMGVVCYHDDLQQIFLFEFSDNAADFVESSETFARIMASVRFLA